MAKARLKPSALVANPGLVGWSVEFEIDRSLHMTAAEVQVQETWLGRQLDALFEGLARPERCVCN